MDKLRRSMDDTMKKHYELTEKHRSIVNQVQLTLLSSAVFTISQVMFYCTQTILEAIKETQDATGD